MDIIRSQSLPCIPSRENSVKNRLTDDGSNEMSNQNETVNITPGHLKRKIRQRILQCRVENKNMYNQKLRSYEKQNEVQAFKASFVVDDEEIGKLFFVERKVQKPQTPEPEVISLDLDKKEKNRTKEKPLLLPPARLPPIYKTKPMTIKSRDFDEEPDIFVHRPTLEERLDEVEGCRYIRRVKKQTLTKNRKSFI